MPFIAIDPDNKERIDITRFEDPKIALEGRTFLCQDCHAEMYIRSGDYYQPHFVHMPGNDDRPCYYRTTGESEVHREAKRQIAKALLESPLGVKAVEIEYPVETKTGRRYIDVYTETERGRYAHEAQISNQGVWEFKQRTEAYRSVGIEAVWWLGGAADTEENRAWVEANCDFIGSITIERETREIINKKLPRDQAFAQVNNGSGNSRLVR